MNSLFRSRLPPCFCLTLVLRDRKKPTASQKWRSELHTSLRSYSQLTLTQSRHWKKVIQPSSKVDRQTGRRKREAGRQEELFFNTSSFFIPIFLMFSLLHLFHTFIFSSLRLCRVPPPFAVAGVSLRVCLASHSCHSRASWGLLSHCG